jgi:hypothetical protein
VETGEVSKRLKIAMETGRRKSAERKARDAEAERAYTVFLEHVAVPVGRQLSNALKVEGLPFTLFTPANGLRLASDRQRDDYIELALERGADGMEVVGHVSHVRGSRTLTQTLPVKAGASPADLADQDVLQFFLLVMRPWFER